MWSWYAAERAALCIFDMAEVTMPVICGLKLTHDGAVALIHGDELHFSIEVEKVDNQRRYSPLVDLDRAVQLLRLGGAEPEDVDVVAIDGWWNGRVGPEAGTGRETGFALPVAGYVDRDPDVINGPTERVEGRLTLAGRTVDYRSYPHTLGHAYAAYCTSPFAREQQDAFVLVWDGGTGPRLYLFDAAARRLHSYGLILDAQGDVYPVFAAFLEPFRDTVDWEPFLTGAFAESNSTDDAVLWPLLSIPGKAMAYAAYGEVRSDGTRILEEASTSGVGYPTPFRWAAQCRRRLARAGLDDASMMATFQAFLYGKLIEALERAITTVGRRLPLCYAGGCALNITFNARLRASGLFETVWIPPFPNDSGSAIGAASADLVLSGGASALHWSAFAGPALALGDIPDGWTGRACTVDELAAILHAEDVPVVFMSGRAELGPRALGHRSIIAAATSTTMHERLNALKGREQYRPIAPICLEEHAPAAFDPGVPEPHMLFEHKVRPEWRQRIPAVVHVNGTARVQTLAADDTPIRRLLVAYHELTGIPVLCNTSANLNGCGFFPDAASAMRWGATKYVWADGMLFCRAHQPDDRKLPQES